MPTRNVNLPKGLDRFVASRVKSGSYANASEVMRTALRLLEKEEREFEEKLVALAEDTPAALANVNPAVLPGQLGSVIPPVLPAVQPVSHQ